MQMEAVLQRQMPVRGTRVGRSDGIAVMNKIDGVVMRVVAVNGRLVLRLSSGEAFKLGGVVRRVGVAEVGTKARRENEVVVAGSAD